MYVQDFILAVIWASTGILGLPRQGGTTARTTVKCTLRSLDVDPGRR